MGANGVKPLSPQEVKQLWTQFDEDNSQGLQKPEMQKLCNHLNKINGVNEPFKRVFVDKIFEEMDTNNDGSISLKEFNDLFQDFYKVYSQKGGGAAGKAPPKGKGKASPGAGPPSPKGPG